jgi:hypothetical protein
MPDKTGLKMADTWFKFGKEGIKLRNLKKIALFRIHSFRAMQKEYSRQ